ncbi:BC1881 family protein [Lactiplantibacillus plantarum]|uniref:BC1881 family protein n=1 Tax=Lactiplantibacillus plantarum TaxID=1590 RepID=UPI001E3568E1|nr:BC1881 family protein [Lactiplantibacillus plantarum]MCC6116950.1 BC1881 family protein [Lactiplantibacillus plantarum]MCW6114498.1 BC1881 family protein [Lactiplantibacillus plantarum]
MDLKDVTTKELSKELESRLGIQTISLQLEEQAKITVEDQKVFSFDGPAVIIVNMD